ncbi:hypothetical protein HDU78_004283 [Chytriomyces hyalinus]|nr:hypothetical protein HDU78_004283 [Chytriomyces hyalinus]
MSTTMNLDQAQECLSRSKKKFAEGGQYESAVRFAEKSIRLCDTKEAQEWLSFLKTNPSTSAASESSASKPSQQQQQQQQEKKKANLEDAKPMLPYTQDQVAGIKRIKAMKAKGDLYGILGLEKSCSDGAVKKAYRKLALQFHPDKCGAPGTDEAFKGSKSILSTSAISHAFTVLGDEGKKEQYDRYGVDPESSASRSGGGGGNPFARGGGHFHGAHEVDPEEIFNMFFGQMAGNGVRFQTNFGGPGFNTRFQQQQQQARRQQQQQQQRNHPGGIPASLMQFLPVIVLMAFSFLSMLSGSSDPSLSETSYAWEYGGSYTMKRATQVHAVPYFVNPRMFTEKYEKMQAGHWKLNNFEKSIESQYYRTIYYNCQNEREYKQRLISSAYSLFGGVNKDRLQAAQNYDMKFCNEVEAWNTVSSSGTKVGKGGQSGSRKRAA